MKSAQYKEVKSKGAGGACDAGQSGACISLGEHRPRYGAL